ncbi:MAG: GNAT family N-acetyltransferase [Flavobacteriales bacterium]|nr:GNAT family N-acetyltransferase [Flavobacteriales bacterium]
MSMIRIVVASDPDDPRLEQLVPMFIDLHAVMHKHGMMQRLAPNGARIWLDGMKAGLERFSRLVLALDGDTVVGFTCGSVKLAPEYLGGERVGHWTQLYVTAEHRRGGVSRAMSERLHEWFTEKGVVSIETQVVRDHPSSVPFAESFGYTVEWINLRKQL